MPRPYNIRMHLILASASPRRSDLLATLGLRFDVATGAELDEARLLSAHDGPLETRLMALARFKGVPIAVEHPQATVLSADTVVVLDGEPLGKARDAVHAREMLSNLSGRMHEVYTAVSVQREADSFHAEGYEITRVYFNELGAETVGRYIERAQPFDYAGAYAIQELGALLVARIEGDYSNVVGLPLGLTARLLAQAGLAVL